MTWIILLDNIDLLMRFREMHKTECSKNLIYLNRQIANRCNEFCNIDLKCQWKGWTNSHRFWLTCQNTYTCIYLCSLYIYKIHFTLTILENNSKYISTWTLFSTLIFILNTKKKTLKFCNFLKFTLQSFFFHKPKICVLLTFLKSFFFN